MATSTEVWPENVRAFNLFQGLGSQWHIGMAGATGLNYQTAYSRMDRMGLSPEEYARLDHELQIMEAAALTAMLAKD